MLFHCPSVSAHFKDDFFLKKCSDVLLLLWLWLLLLLNVSYTVLSYIIPLWLWWRHRCGLLLLGCLSCISHENRQIKHSHNEGEACRSSTPVLMHWCLDAAVTATRGDISWWYRHTIYLKDKSVDSICFVLIWLIAVSNRESLMRLTIARG